MTDHFGERDPELRRLGRAITELEMALASLNEFQSRQRDYGRLLGVLQARLDEIFARVRALEERNA